jgi:N-acyl-D-aspartate/D-glutamate deacylase
MFDLIIRNGRIVDGTGAPAFSGDVAVENGRIVAIGRVSGSARDQIDAEGRLVTPGFVDPHGHYDGQVTWDDTLAPSFGHGVTTIVLGNCGVGFAPVRPDQANQAMLIDLMEGVEDIPGKVLREGINWSWESFPEYLDALEARTYSMDIGTMVPHGALRPYVMGDRAVDHQPATPDEIAEMARLSVISRPRARRCPAPSPPATNCLRSAAPSQRAAESSSWLPAARREAPN